jgi:hypothetical protein
MNLQENIHRIKEVMGVPKRVYDYEQGRNTVPDRLPLDVLKLIDAGVLFITPAIDGDPKSPTYKEWLDESGSHIITLHNIDHSSADSWINKAVTKQADPAPLHTKDFTQHLYDGKYNQILWGLEKLGIDPNTMLFDETNDTMGINESIIDPYLKRRFPEVLDAVLEAAKWYSPSMTPDFNTFLDRAIYSGIMSVFSDEYTDTNVKQMHELEDILKDTIYGNKDLLNKIRSIHQRKN